MPIPFLASAGSMATKLLGGGSNILGKGGATASNIDHAAGGGASSGMLGAQAGAAAEGAGNTLSSLGKSDVNATQKSLGDAVSDAQAMTEMQMQASSAMAKMNMMASINDGLNSVMKKAGESFKSAAQ
jgi:hypothetical protein